MVLEPEEEVESEDISDEEREIRWQDDMSLLIAEHDREIWLMTAISKLISQGKRKVSQFAYLRKLSCQT